MIIKWYIHDINLSGLWTVPFLVVKSWGNGMVQAASRLELSFVRILN